MDLDEELGHVLLLQSHIGLDCFFPQKMEETFLFAKNIIRKIIIRKNPFSQKVPTLFGHLNNFWLSHEQKLKNGD